MVKLANTPDSDSGEEILAGSNPVVRTKKVVSSDTTFFIHYGVMVYHHATSLRAYHQKERFFRSFLHIITLQRVLSSVMMIYNASH